MFFSAHMTNAGNACVAAMATASSNSGVPGSVRAASHVAAVASWVATNMSAAWCLTAWNIPIDAPELLADLGVLARHGHARRGTTRRLGGGEEATEHDRGVACAGEDAVGGRVGGEGHRAQASGRVGVRRAPRR